MNSLPKQTSKGSLVIALAEAQAQVQKKNAVAHASLASPYNQVNRNNDLKSKIRNSYNPQPGYKPVAGVGGLNQQHSINDISSY